MLINLCIHIRLINLSVGLSYLKVHPCISESMSKALLLYIPTYTRAFTSVSFCLIARSRSEVERVKHFIVSLETSAACIINVDFTLDVIQSVRLFFLSSQSDTNSVVRFFLSICIDLETETLGNSPAALA